MIVMTEIIIIVATATICICNLAVLGLLTKVFIFDSLQRNDSKNNKPLSPVPTSNPNIDEEELKLAKKRYIETEKAFEEMMNFSAEKAYGINQTEKE